MSAQEQPKQIVDVRAPACTRRDTVRYLTRSGDKRLWENSKTGKVYITDQFGYAVDGDKKKIVFNGKPEDLRTPRSGQMFQPGDVVYMVRFLSGRRKVYAATVLMDEGYNVLINPVRREEITMIRNSRMRDDGSIVVPKSTVFGSAAQLREHMERILADLDQAQRDYQALGGDVVQAGEGK